MIEVDYGRGITVSGGVNSTTCTTKHDDFRCNILTVLSRSQVLVTFQIFKSLNSLN